MRRKLLVTGVLVFVVGLVWGIAGSERALAVQCGDAIFQYVESCNNVTCTPNVVTRQYGCYDNNDGKGCVTTMATYGCYWRNDSQGNDVCKRLGGNTVVSCSGGGGSGGGGGGSDCACPPGEVPNYYNPPQTFCPNPGTACPPHRLWVDPATGEYDICGQTINGNNKLRVERGYCAPPPCQSSIPQTPTQATPPNPPAPATVSSFPVLVSWVGLSGNQWGFNCNGNANNYLLRIGTSPTFATWSYEYWPIPSNQVGINFTAATDTTYYWRVWAHNGYAWSAASPIWSFRVQANNVVSGTVYSDPEGTCSTSTPQNVGGALGIAWGSTTGTMNANGTFSINTGATSGTNNLVLSNLPAGYICSPGCGNCPTRTGVASPSTGNNFFLTTSRSAWWQVEGAGIYAGQTGSGVTVRSQLPSSTTRLIIPGTNDLAALVKASTGAPNIGAGSQISTTQWQAVSRYQGKKMDYSFFAANLGLTSSTADNFGSGSGADTISKPAYAPAQDFWYQNGNATVNSAWNVGASEKYIIFVNGDLTVNANVTVASGGFLAFIVNGGVTVGTGVTSLQGLYILDNNFTTNSVASGDDVQLTVQGSVITWSGVSLGRDLGSTNINTPAEKFTYRPDLIVNMPDKMKIFALRWQEVAPGTVGN